MIGIDFGFGSLEAEFWRFAFVMTRIGAALFAAPLFGAAAITPQVRVIITGALAIFVCCWTPVVAPPAVPVRDRWRIRWSVSPGDWKSTAPVWPSGQCGHHATIE